MLPASSALLVKRSCHPTSCRSSAATYSRRMRAARRCPASAQHTTAPAYTRTKVKTLNARPENTPHDHKLRAPRRMNKKLINLTIYTLEKAGEEGS
jgi:hypothetical protein